MSIFKAGRVIAGDSKWTGDEPDWHGWEQWTVDRFFRVRSRALNFYNYYLDAASMKPMVLDWMKKNDTKMEKAKKKKKRCRFGVYKSHLSYISTLGCNE